MDESVRIPLVDGPMCPRCGCRDSKVLQVPRDGSWFASGQARCNHCGTRFGFRNKVQQQPMAISDPQPMALPPVQVQSPGPFSMRVDVIQPSVSIHIEPGHCPDCGVMANAYSTKGRTQYRKCPECGKRFKTMKEAG